MIVPDQNHINQVREALWRRSGAGASVMVGSGFSRNARKVRLDSRPLPMLDELAGQILRILYPDRETTQSPPPERILRLAQEYQGEFGPAALHDTLRRLVRDDDYVPGDAHKRLIQLPWADVFTTNWDTLLERACKLAPDRSYTIVRSSADIPRGARPRVVNLHGSLPNPPLILTDEDYRRYPFDFAPFVNTVQQAMMETVFLLIGFSGNDPNFLHWSGWVRDNLGDAAPKIYLAGYLQLSRPTRHMLRGRNVIPIDLAEHPKVDQWPDHLRHDYATEWILSSLECGQPYDISKWPTPRAEAFCPDRDPLLQPIVANVSTEPKEEPLEPPPQVSLEDTLEVARDTLAIWAHNRMNYPGWLVLPSLERRNLRVSTERWTPIILKALPEMEASERLEAVHELVWRYERALAKMPDGLEIAAQEALASVDCARRTVSSSDSKAIDWTTIRRSWREVGLALLTAARYRLDASEFDMRVGALDPFLNDDPDVDHRVHHERCLWALWSLDYTSLAERLDAWATIEGDRAWMFRKSALLRELGRDKEATRLSEQALEEIRAMPQYGQDLAAPSREGWALWGVLNISTHANVSTEWIKLAPLNCDPSMEITHLTHALEVNRADAVTPQFDLGVRPRESPRFFTSHIEAAAYRSIRLSEVGGLPLSVDFSAIAGPLLKLAAESLATLDHGLAIRQMLRVARYDRDKALMRVLSRERVAALGKSTAHTLAGISKAVLRYAISWIEATASGRNVFWAERARVAMEGLSRLVLRLDGVAVEEVFSEALNLYRNPRVASEFWLHQPLRNLFQRSWETLSDQQRSQRLLDVLEAPIVGSDSLRTQSSYYPDPGEVLSAEDLAPERLEDNEARWASIVAKLVRSLGIKGMARERAAGRLATVAFMHRLTNTEESKVAEVLWELRCDSGGDLPGGTYVFDFAFILLPQPTAGAGRSGFGRKWLSGDIAEIGVTSPYGRGSFVGLTVRHTNPKKADDILWQAGMAIPFLRRHRHSLALSPEEGEYLTEVIKRWTETRVRGITVMNQLLTGLFKQSLQGACHGLSWILSEMDIRSSLAKRLYEMVQELNDADVPGYGLLPGIVNATPELSDDVALLMSTGLVSDDYNAAANAMPWLHRWMVWASDPVLEFTAPPEHLVREVGIAIATRRQTVLAQALYSAKWVFKEGSKSYRRIIGDLVLKGLGYLTEELRYDREQTFGAEFDVPLARWRCTQVARAMAEQGLAEIPVVRKWLEMGRDDPLPEVRRVADSWYGTTEVGALVADDLRRGPQKNSDTDERHAEGDGW